MQHFKFVPEEAAAVRLFRQNCVADDLIINLPRRGGSLLKCLVEGTQPKGPVSEQQISVLARRGLIMAKEGKWIVTELGRLMMAFAEAAGYLPAGGEVQPIGIGRKKAPRSAKVVSIKRKARKAA